jgi:hypothetical protein
MHNCIGQCERSLMTRGGWGMWTATESKLLMVTVSGVELGRVLCGWTLIYELRTRFEGR